MNLVYDFLNKRIKLTKEDSIVVGVSSGPDSMFLLYLLLNLQKQIGFKIIVAHINHNVRVESDSEELFLKKYCFDNNVIFESMKITEFKKENFHAYARNIRYEFYQSLINKYKANYLMTAHHGDDLMETILMRLTRGSTIKGYSGIPLITKRDNYKIIRPLLFLTKDEIKEFNDKNNIPYFIDKSNYSSKYTRNRYRMKVLPFMKEENKNVHLKFLKFSELLEEYDNYINRIVNSVYSKVYKNQILNISLFLNNDELICKLVLENIFKDLFSNLDKITDKNICMLMSFIKKNKTGTSLNLPNCVTARIDYGMLKFEGESKSNDYLIELRDNLVLENGMKFIKINTKENGNNILHLNSKEVRLPLYVRNKKNGDFIELKGMNKKRKVSDIFIDCKISREQRKSYPVVVDSDDNIIWIPKLKKSKYDSKNYEKCDIIFKCL